MKQAPRWSDEELAEECNKAVNVFREERIREPLTKYLDTFDNLQGSVEELLEHLVDLTVELDDEAIAGMLSSPGILDAFRYLSGPPVSVDDLKVLADVASVTPSFILANPQKARELFITVLEGLDRRRFPWVVDKREPTETEKTAAIVASTALMATQRLATDRRNEGKETQESAVKQALLDIGFSEKPSCTIQTLEDAPRLSDRILDN